MSAVATYSQIRVLGASAIAASNAADTAELALATITVPAGIMGLNGILRISTEWSYTSSANNKLLKVRFSGISGTAFNSAVATTQTGGHAVTMIANRNSAASQVGSSALFTNNSGIIATATTTDTVNTAAATTISITGQKASAGETLTLESYLVELILP